MLVSLLVTCQPCDVTCKTCDETSSTCLSCYFQQFRLLSAKSILFIKVSLFVSMQLIELHLVLGTNNMSKAKLIIMRHGLSLKK